MVELRLFREAHADIFQCAPEHLEQFKLYIPMLDYWGPKQQAGSFVHDGRILFIGAFSEAAPGVAELMIFPSIYAAKMPARFFREAKWWVDHLKSRFRRVQCWGEDTEVSKRWLSHLGFVYEGRLAKYTSEGSSVLIWGLVSDD